MIITRKYGRKLEREGNATICNLIQCNNRDDGHLVAINRHDQPDYRVDHYPATPADIATF